MKNFPCTMCILAYIYLSPAFASTEVNGYLCIPEKATGFSYRNHEWIATNFSVQNIKYILTSKDGKWLWKKMGETNKEKHPQYCVKHESGYMDCEFMYRKVSFNSQTLRFQIFSDGSYVVHEKIKKELEQKKNNDTFIEIGTCSTL